MEGIVSTIDDETIEVQAGSMRVRVQKDDVQRFSEKPEKMKIKQRRPAVPKTILPSVLAQTASPGIEIDLRG